MADQPDDRRTKPEAQADQRPAHLPRPEREEQREDDTLDPEFRVIREQLGRLVRQEVRQEITVVREEIRELHIGPLPHPSTLEAYDKIVSGSAKMIFDNFDEQGKHRRRMETYALKWGTVRSFAGVFCAFVLAMTIFVFSYRLIQDGHDWAGATIATVNLAALVAVFVYGTHVLRDERVQKARIMSGQRDENGEKKS